MRQLENAVFRAIVLADGEADRRRVSADRGPRRGFQGEIPDAPVYFDPHPAYTGPALIGAEDSIPRTIEVVARRRQEFARHSGRHDSGEIRSLEEIEADMIRLALGRYRGHMTEVAKRLNIGRSTLYRKMRDYGLEERVG